jgi:hypothetical protein
MQAHIRLRSASVKIKSFEILVRIKEHSPKSICPKTGVPVNGKLWQGERYQISPGELIAFNNLALLPAA